MARAGPFGSGGWLGRGLGFVLSDLTAGPEPWDTEPGGRHVILISATVCRSDIQSKNDLIIRFQAIKNCNKRMSVCWESIEIGKTSIPLNLYSQHLI